MRWKNRPSTMSPVMIPIVFMMMVLITMVHPASMKDSDNSIPKNGIPTCAPGEYLDKYELDPDHEHHGETELEKEDTDGGHGGEGGAGELKPGEAEILRNMTAMEGQVTDGVEPSTIIGQQLIFSLIAIPLMIPLVTNRIY